MPALFTRTSSRPKRSAACLTKPAASTSRPMSASTKSAWPPLASISASTRLPRSASRSANATFAPSAANRRTVASPMPDAPPVTAAIFPLSRPMPHVPPGVCASNSLSDAALAVRERDQRVVDPPVDLDALVRKPRPLAIRALAGDTDLVHAVLPRRRLDRGDLLGQPAPVVFQGNEQIGLERDEEVPRALVVGRSTAEHAERVHRHRQRVALVCAERQEGAASRRPGVRRRGGGPP